MKIRVIENRLYLVCYLCKKFFYPPKQKGDTNITEITDIDEKNRLASYLEFGRIE